MIQPPSTADGEAIYNDWLLGQVYALPKVYKDTRATVQQLHDHFKATGVAHGDWIRIKSGLHALLRERRIVPAWPFAQTYTAVGERRYVKWFGRYVLKAEFDDEVWHTFQHLPMARAPGTVSVVREELGGGHAVSRAVVRASLKRLADAGRIRCIGPHSYVAIIEPVVRDRYWLNGVVVDQADFDDCVAEVHSEDPEKSARQIVKVFRSRARDMRTSGRWAFAGALERNRLKALAPCP